MRTRRVRRGPSWLLSVGLTVLIIAALFAAGSRDMMVREFALGVPNAKSVALLRPSQQVCEGSVTSPNQIKSVGIWGASVTGLSRMTVEVKDANDGRPLASGQVEVTAPGEHVGRLTSTVAGGRPLRICLIGDLNTVSLLGGPAVQPKVVMSGKRRGLEFSLVLLSEKRSLLSSLSTAFKRAALWRPSWVGTWTFWLLSIGLLATFGLAVVAVASAAAEDGEEDGRGGVQDPEGDPPHSSGGEPQTVPAAPRAEA